MLSTDPPKHKPNIPPKDATIKVMKYCVDLEFKLT